MAELQAEPFYNKLLPDYEVALQKKLMNGKRFREVISRARRAGFDENYLLGVEWWYWVGKNHDTWEIWNEAKKLFDENS